MSLSRADRVWLWVCVAALAAGTFASCAAAYGIARHRLAHERGENPHPRPPDVHGHR